LVNIRDSFGDEFEQIKVIVEAKDLEKSTVKITEENGFEINIKNNYKFLNPTVSTNLNE